METPFVVSIVPKPSGTGKDTVPLLKSSEVVAIAASVPLFVVATLGPISHLAIASAVPPAVVMTASAALSSHGC